MKRKNMGVNAVLSAIKTALGIVFPLITFPYATRILGVDNIGKFNFSSSVVSYTALFAAVGVRMYAIRECSMVRDDKEQVNSIASALFSINFGATVLAYAGLFVLCLFVPKLNAYWPLICVLSLEILFTTIGCEWVYSVYEDYLYVTIRSLCVHTLSLVLLFCFVHTADDLMNYTIVSTVAVCGANLANVIGRRKYCRIRLTPHVDLKKHLPPIMVFFLNAVSTTIYVNSDVLILGFMTSDTFVGLYTVAARIYTIIKNILAAVITVSVPRLSAYWSENNAEKVKETPIFAVAGTDDTIMDADKIETFVNSILTLGSEARFDLLEGKDHFSTCNEAFTRERLSWMFNHSRETSSISQIYADPQEKRVIGIYAIDGTVLNKEAKGLVIFRYSDGSTIKVIR